MPTISFYAKDESYRKFMDLSEDGQKELKKRLQRIFEQVVDEVDGALRPCKPRKQTGGDNNVRR